MQERETRGGAAGISPFFLLGCVQAQQNLLEFSEDKGAEFLVLVFLLEKSTLKNHQMTTFSVQKSE